jgi:UDP-N-acetylmuramate dehydrogenase
LNMHTNPAIRGTYTHNFSSHRLSWFRVGGIVETLYQPADIDDLAYFLKNTNSCIHSRWAIVGAGSNMFIAEEGFRGVLIKLPWQEIRYCSDGTIEVDAGALDQRVAKFALKHGIGGLEFLTGIPGSIGGAVAMNAGCYGREFKDIFVDGTFMDRAGNILRLRNSDMHFGYRSSPLMGEIIAINVRLAGVPSSHDAILAEMERIQRARRETQPIGSKTCGSTFKNPPGNSAWQLIHEAGCSGLRVGGASVSTKHCNFLVNDTEATAADMVTLMRMIQEAVRTRCGVELEREIRILR